MESWCLRMIKECLGSSFMRLGVLFIAPRQLGAVGGNLGRPKLPSVGWRTGQSGVPPDNHCSCPVPDFLPNRAQPTIADWWQLAHRTVRCPLPTVGASHASPADLAADRCAGGRWLTGQSGAPSDSPVHHRTVQWIIAVRRQSFPRAASSPEASLAHRTLSGAPPDSSVHPDRAAVGCTQPTLFQSFFLCFYHLDTIH
jgi:hypothetical protein